MPRSGGMRGGDPAEQPRDARRVGDVGPRDVTCAPAARAAAMRLAVAAARRAAARPARDDRAPRATSQRGDLQAQAPEAAGDQVGAVGTDRGRRLAGRRRG